jgi:hypothetical protein
MVVTDLRRPKRESRRPATVTFRSPTSESQQSTCEFSALRMPEKQSCAQYKYVLTSTGPKIVAVPDYQSKDEGPSITFPYRRIAHLPAAESPADYNAGGYLPIKVKDVFKDGRYTVVRKLGCVIGSYTPSTILSHTILDAVGVISPLFGWLRIRSEFKRTLTYLSFTAKSGKIDTLP